MFKALTVEVEPLKAGRHEVFVVRDDRLGGGTKERACLPFLQELMSEGASEFYYASPFCGFAQVALAKSARELKVPCTIFAERDKRYDDQRAHDFTKAAADFGADIVLVEDLKSAIAGSARAASLSATAFDIPLGFDHPYFHRNFKRALGDAWTKVQAQVGEPLQRVWLPLGSGTFAKCMRQVVPADVELCLVDVGVLGSQDQRIRAASDLPLTSYHRAVMQFSEPCSHVPPIPSNTHYDAKLWTFLVSEARERDLWWNVAR